MHTERFNKPADYRAVTSGTLNFCDSKFGATVSGTIVFDSYYITVTINTIEKGLGVALFATQNYIIREAMKIIKEKLKLEPDRRIIYSVEATE